MKEKIFVSLWCLLRGLRALEKEDDDNDDDDYNDNEVFLD